VKAETRLLQELVAELRELRSEMNQGRGSLRLDDLMTLEAFAVRHADKIRSLAALRFQRAEQHKNGLADYGAFVKRGKNVFVVVPRYLDWLLQRPTDSESGATPAAAGGGGKLAPSLALSPTLSPKEKPQPRERDGASQASQHPEGHHCE
jgi:hypothetical protein